MATLTLTLTAAQADLLFELVRDHAEACGESVQEHHPDDGFDLDDLRADLADANDLLALFGPEPTSGT